jgi:hypothetical protein
MLDLRIEFRSRNNALWHLVFDTHPSVAEFCRVHGFHQVKLGSLLNLTLSPYSRRHEGNLTPIAQALCDLSGLGRADLFPPSLYADNIPKRGAAEIDSRRCVSLAAAKRLALPEASTDAVFGGELRSALKTAIKTLTPSQQKVIAMRFGLGEDGVEYTLDEVAQVIPNRQSDKRYRGGPVTKERIRQIEATAMRKLRRIRPLRPFVHAKE